MAVKVKKWVLIVDDEELVRKGIADLLHEKFQKEVKIIEARDGIEAEAKLKNQTFHLIITDIRMPRRDGEELIEMVREGGFNQTTPIIVVSSYVTPEMEKKFPFISILEKPFDNDKLTSMVKTNFKLESTEKMIEGSIFSSLLDNSIAFLKTALARDDFDVGQMTLKKTGDTVNAEHAAVINVQIGKVTNTFSVLVSEKTLEELRENSNKISGSRIEVICRSLGYVILKNVLTDCGIIDSNEVKVKNILDDSSELTDKQGILVPINAINIDYKVFATTNFTKKKNAA